MSEAINLEKNGGVLSAAAIKQGAFSVDSSGQATYRIPIEVPPGVNGLSPQLGLSYNHRGGNGPLGLGWSIEGVSSIVRVGANYSTDGYKSAINFDHNDRLSLDGQRLVNVDGDYWGSEALYATEVQRWVKVVAGMTERDGFIVVSKNGETREYGKTADSRILVDAGSGPVRVWALNAIQDLNGNRIEYTYTQNPIADLPVSGAYYLQTIKYTTRKDGTALANRFVVFSYTERDDKIVSYIGGCKIEVDCLLDKITSYIGEANNPANVVTTYNLHYTTSHATRRSRLASLLVTGAAAEGSPALPDINVTWQDVNTPSIGSDQQNAVLGPGKILSMDVNGDGLTDVVQFFNDPESGVLCVDTHLASYSNGKVAFALQPTSTLQTAYPDAKKLFATDVDGDGRGDLVVIYPDASNGNSLSIDIALSNGSGFSLPQTVKTGNAFANNDLFFTVDLNGDGRTDIVQATRDPQSQTLVLNCYVTSVDSSNQYFSYAMSVPTGLPFPAHSACLFAADVNGDGITDLVLLTEDSNTQQTRIYCLITTLAQQTAFSPFNVISNGELLDFSFSQIGTMLPADSNGDGLTDIVRIYQDDDGWMKFQSYLSDGVGHFTAGAVSAGFTPCPNLFPMGFFGGNATDVLGCWTDPQSGNWSFDIYSASPSGNFSQTVTVNTNQTLPELSFLIGDVTGSGKADFLYAYLDTNGCVNIQPYLSVGLYPDLVSSIEDQLGGLIGIEYQPLTNSTVYSSGQLGVFPKSSAKCYCNHLSPAQFPIQSVIGQSVYVVSGYTLSNAPGRNRYLYSFDFSLSYADAQIDLLGRGWQGFRQVSTLNRSTRLLTRQAYNQDFPLTGQIAAVSSELDGTPLELTLTTYLSRASSIYPQENSIEVVTTGTLKYTYTDGVFDYVTAKVFADVQNGKIIYYDAYGNNLREAWYGYVEYIDPANVMSPNLSHPNGSPILPGMLMPLQSNEMVYRYRDFVNDRTAWVLGLPAHEKTSQNATDSDISSFNQGDLTLSATTYFPTTYNCQSAAHWDSSNHCFLTSTYQYDGYGNRVEETLPGNRTTRYVYETTYHTYVDQTVSPKNTLGTALVCYAGYDPRFGVRVAEQDANGFIFVSALDGFGRLTGKQGPVPAGTQSDVNLLPGLVTGSKRNTFMEANVVSLETVAYLDDGKQGIYSQHQVLQQFPHDSARSLVPTLKFVDGLSRVRVTAVHSGNGGSKQYSTVTCDYTSNGKLARKAIPFFCTDPSSATAALYVSYQYDALDRPVLAVQPGGANGEQPVTTTWSYDKSGVVKETQAVGATEQFTQYFTHHWFDDKDCIVQTTVATNGGATTSFLFDPMARNWQSVDPNGIRNSLTFDSLGRKTSLDNPDQNTTGTAPGIRYRYDAVTGLLASQTDAAQANTGYSYDLLGRILTATFQDGRKFSYQYDTAANGLGHVSAITITQGDSVESARSFTYDEYGNIAQETLTISGEVQTFTTRSKYDPVKRLVEQTLPDQSVLQRTFTDGLLSEQSLDGAQITYSAFTPIGNYSVVNYNNGAAFAYQRNPLDQIYAESLNVDGQVLFASHYQYDQLNQVLQIQEQQGGSTSMQSFSYQSKRLVSAKIPGFDANSYQYDAGGNLKAKNANQYSYDAHFPRQVESGGAPVYSATRDACGRTLSRTEGGQTVEFQYDGLGCLRMVKDAGGHPLLQAMSDDRGQRLRQVCADGTITLTINAYYQVVKTATAAIIRKTLFDTTGALASIVTQSGTRQTLYFRRDRKGSVTHCLNARGTLQCQLTYDAFGQIQAVSGLVPEIPLYESRYWNSATGLYYFGERYYDPSLGTFLTPDTRLGGASALQCNVWNRFAFELNNPLNHVDPDGHASWWIAGLVIGAVAILGGIAIVATGGAASGLVGVAVGAAAGALIGGGATAVGYSIQHRNDFSWKDFGIQVGVSAGIGAAAGGLLAGISGPIAASAHPIIYGALSGGVIGAAAGAATTALTSVAEGQSVSGSAVGISAALGFAFGAIGGGVSGKIGANAAPRMNQVANDVELAVQRGGGRYDIPTEQIIPGPGVNGGMPIRVAWQEFTPRQIMSARRALIAGAMFADFFLPSIQTAVGNVTPS